MKFPLHSHVKITHALMPYKPLLAAVLILLAPSPTPAQTTAPRSGLVLSGGGARGLAHIGVLKVLEEVDFPIDHIGGTSMGAIVGGLYASGYSAAQLEALVTDIDWIAMFSDQVRRRYVPIEEKDEGYRYVLDFPIRNRQLTLPSGLVAGQEVYKLLNGLTWHVQEVTDFNRLPIPFVCVATDLSTGEAVVIRSGSLADAMRASMTLPSIFSPPVIDGRRVLDGGIVRNLPVVDVIEMGADILIGVDVSTALPTEESLNSILDILNQTVSFSIEQSSRAQRELATILLVPDMPEAGLLSFEQAQAIIDAGEAAARARIDELRQIADRLNAGRPLRPSRPHVPLEGQPILIRSIRYEGLDPTHRAMIDSELSNQLPRNTLATRADVNQTIDRLFSLGYFERVTYRLENLDRGYRLVLQFAEKRDDRFRVGLRYDSREKAALLFNGTFRGRLLRSSTFRLTSRLGDRSYLEGHLNHHAGTYPILSISLKSGYHRDEFDQYLGSVNAGTAQADRFSNEFWMGPMVLGFLQSGLGYRYEWVDTRAVAGSIRRPIEAVRPDHGPFAFLMLDTADDAHYPRSGQYLRLRADVGNPMHASRRYERYEAVWRNHLPFTELVTAHLNFLAGYSAGALPTYRAFYLGDVRDVVGFAEDAINGTSIRMAQIALQMEVMDDHYLTLKANTVAADDFWGTPESRIPYRFGWGASYGINTVLGPLELTVMGNGRDFMPLGFASVGFRF